MPALKVWDLTDGYDKIREFMIAGISFYINTFAEVLFYKIKGKPKKPYWKRTAIKDLETIRYLNSLILNDKISRIINNAIYHFATKRKARAYNVLLKKVYLGHLRTNSEAKKYKHYHYYLAIRIRKITVKIKNTNIRRIAYLIQVGKMCPFGQYYHKMSDPLPVSLRGKSIIQPTGIIT